MSKENFVVNVNPTAIEEQETEMRKTNEFSHKLKFDVNNYLNLKLGPNETSKQVKVRLLPISASDGNVFLSIKTHSMKVDKDVSQSGFKTFICLDDPLVNKEGTHICPLCKKSQMLMNQATQARQEGKEQVSKSYYSEARALHSKKTFIVRVIDRDHEDEGVKFWRFNDNSKHEGIWDKLMALYNTRKQESIEAGFGDYNIFDLYEGKDIIINITKTAISDGHGGIREGVSYNVTDAGFKSKLSEDTEKANKWLTDEKTWSNVYAKKSPEYLEVIANGGVPVYNAETGKYTARTTTKDEVIDVSDFAITDNAPIANNNDSELPF